MKNRLEALRKARGIKQEELAEALEVSRQTIGSLENGRYNPSILLADEPVASLDPVTGRQILCLLRDIQRQRGVSILMNSHNLDLSLEFSTHIVGMNRGRVVFDGAPGDVTEAVLRDIYGEAAAV